MADSSPSFRAERLVWRFRKSGADGEVTKPFEGFAMSVRGALLQQFTLGPAEVPAVACVHSNDRWVLLTTERLVWADGGAVTSVPVAQLSDVTIDSNDLLSEGKLGLSRLRVVTPEGRSYKIEIEKGQPFWGFWNMLKAAARSSA
jgi:hypothetical protein